MNEHFTPRGPGEGIELARQPDFDLCGLRVRPSACETAWDGHTLRLEPRVMQVLVALARAEGEVLSRDDLITSCWRGRVVGEDAINRCIARVRRVFEASGSALTITTIPRVGYRLEAPATATRTSPAPAATRSSRWPAVAVIALLGVGLAFAGWRLWPRPAWTVAGYRPFAAETLIERHPAFSPDGRTLAYAAGPDVESRRILLRSLTGGPPVWLTSGPGDDYAPTWSPAGDRVAFARYIMGKPCQILVRRLDSGPETPVGACRHDDRTRLAWSHDGARIYFTDGAGERDPSALQALDLASGQVRALTRPRAAQGESDSEPTLAPDGRRLAFLRDRSWGSPQLGLLDLASGRTAFIPTPGVTPGVAAWTPDGKALIVPSDRAGDFSLWRVDASGRDAPVRLLTGLRAIGRLAASRAGQLAVETDSARTNLARLGAEGEIAPANSSDWSPDFAADGSIAFISNRGGGKAVWIMRPGQSPAQVSNLDFDHVYGARWSPDGRRIGFAGARGDAAGLYVANADGLGVIRLNASGLDFGAPTWSTDGASLIAPARDANGWRLVRASLDPGVPARAVSDYGWVSVRNTPGGLYGVRSDAPGVWRIGPDGHRTRVSDGVTSADPDDWTVSQGRIVFLVRSARNQGDIYSLPLAGGPRRLLGKVDRVSGEPGLAVDPKTGAPVYPRIVTEDTDIGLMRLVKAG